MTLFKNNNKLLFRYTTCFCARWWSVLGHLGGGMAYDVTIDPGVQISTQLHKAHCVFLGQSLFLNITCFTRLQYRCNEIFHPHPPICSIWLWGLGGAFFKKKTNLRNRLNPSFCHRMWESFNPYFNERKNKSRPPSQVHGWAWLGYHPEDTWLWKSPPEVGLWSLLEGISPVTWIISKCGSIYYCYAFKQLFAILSIKSLGLS